jgi:hypothetical protein
VGQLIRLNRDATPLRPEPILSGLPRVSHVAAGDLNGDGREDLVLCAFGNYLGRCRGWKDAPMEASPSG